MTWEDMQKACTQPSKVIKQAVVSQVASQQVSRSEEEMEEEGGETLSPAEEAYLSASQHSDLADHLDQFDSLPTLFPPSMLNHNLPWRTSLESSEPEMDNFIRDSDPQKQRFDKQVSVSYITYGPCAVELSRPPLCVL
ncbi:hypothetical protein EON64_04780 [archaeon]|nr:MAG: hypothetical protein EON64_04780 [archaeon]